MHAQVAVTDQTAISGSMARFGVGFAINRHVHAGAEVEEGWMSGDALPDGAVARGGGGGALGTGPLSGNTLDMKLVGGLHTDVGAFRISGDVAAGMRDTSVSTDLGRTSPAARRNRCSSCARASTCSSRAHGRSVWWPARTRSSVTTSRSARSSRSSSIVE